VRRSCPYPSPQIGAEILLDASPPPGIPQRRERGRGPVSCHDLSVLGGTDHDPPMRGEWDYTPSGITQRVWRGRRRRASSGNDARCSSSGAEENSTLPTGVRSTESRLPSGVGDNARGYLSGHVQ
jgi:hypothetical protein